MNQTETKKMEYYITERIRRMKTEQKTTISSNKDTWLSGQIYALSQLAIEFDLFVENLDITQVRGEAKEMKTIEVSDFSLKLFKEAKQKSQNTRITLQTDDGFVNMLVTVFNQSNWGK